MNNIALIERYVMPQRDKSKDFRDCHLGANGVRDFLSKIRFEELAVEMVRESLESAERDELVKQHGYKAFDYNE